MQKITKNLFKNYCKVVIDKWVFFLPHTIHFLQALPVHCYGNLPSCDVIKWTPQRSIWNDLVRWLGFLSGKILRFFLSKKLKCVRGESSVTRLGQFLPLGRLFILKRFYYRSSPKCGASFLTDKFVHLFWQKRWIGSQFGRFFSQYHLVIPGERRQAFFWKLPIEKVSSTEQLFYSTISTPRKFFNGCPG
jgi:hypothetical protein